MFFSGNAYIYHYEKTEIVIIGLCLLAVVLNLALVPGGVLLTVLSFMLLAMIYFNFGFLLLNGIRLRHLFKSESYKGIKAPRMLGAIGTGFALSMIVVGLLFRLLSWPGSYVAILGGVFFTFIALCISIIKYASSKDPFYVPILVRAGILCAAGLFFMFVSSDDVMDFKYRNYPEYLEAFKARQADPGNTELQEKLEEETQKMERGM